MTLEDDRSAVIRGIQEHFGVRLVHYENASSGPYRRDASVHGFFSFPGPEPTEETKSEIRRWVESRGWQFSRQIVKNKIIPDRNVEYIFLAPMVLVKLERCYHATRRVSIPSIKETGLRRSLPELQTTDRTDCEGNIYVCEALGTIEDAGIAGTLTAHWWRAHLAEMNRFNDPDWAILQIEVSKVDGVRLYRDIWSESGILVGGIDTIPPDVIHVVWP